MSPESLTLDAPEIDASPLDTPEVETPETDTSSTEVETPSTPVEGAAPKPIVAGELAIRDGKLSEQAKATISELRTKDPQLAKQLERALYQQDAIRREFPNGWKDVQQLKATVEKYGGAESIQKQREEVEYFNGLDAAFTAGDPKFIAAMTDTPEGQQAFLKLGPAMVDKWAEMHPEGYNNRIARAFLADMGQEGIPLTLEKMGFYLQSGDTAQAGKILESLINYYNRVAGYASKKAETPQIAKPEGNDRERQLNEREQAFTRNEWKRETAQQQQPIYQSEWQRLTAGRKLSDVQRASIQELFSSRMERSVEQHKTKLEAYFGAGDKAGFMRYADSVNKSEIPRILRAVFDAIVPSKPGPRPAPGGLKQNLKPELNNPATGATWLPSRPEAAKVDPQRTTPAMIRQGKAVTRDGKVVQWQV